MFSLHTSGLDYFDIEVRDILPVKDWTYVVN